MSPTIDYSEKRNTDSKKIMIARDSGGRGWRMDEEVEHRSFLGQ